MGLDAIGLGTEWTKRVRPAILPLTLRRIGTKEQLPLRTNHLTQDNILQFSLVHPSAKRFESEFTVSKLSSINGDGEVDG